DDFIKNQVVKYKNAPNLPVHFVGSIAHFFEDILQKKLTNYQLKLGKIIRHPIDGLVKFHKLS
ncbi:MAG: N-acetylglucosamine kinase, partial [Bacteroidota bacterium]